MNDFKTGDRVLVTEVYGAVARFVVARKGQEATITSVDDSRYIVEFEDGFRCFFFEDELELVED